LWTYHLREYQLRTGPTVPAKEIRPSCLNSRVGRRRGERDRPEGDTRLVAFMSQAGSSAAQPCLRRKVRVRQARAGRRAGRQAQAGANSRFVGCLSLLSRSLGRIGRVRDSTGQDRTAQVRSGQVQTDRQTDSLVVSGTGQVFPGRGRIGKKRCESWSPGVGTCACACASLSCLVLPCLPFACQPRLCRAWLAPGWLTGRGSGSIEHTEILPPFDYAPALSFAAFLSPPRWWGRGSGCVCDCVCDCVCVCVRERERVGGCVCLWRCEGDGRRCSSRGARRGGVAGTLKAVGSFCFCFHTRARSHRPPIH
jgi:hypothetical protein